MTQHAKWTCLKCGNKEYVTSELKTSGSGLMAILNVEDKKFTTLSCSKCRFTELYQADASSMETLLDLMTG